MRRVGPAVLAALIAAALLASTAAASGGATEVPGGFPEAPDDYEVSGKEALAAADADPKILARKRSLGEDEELTAALSVEAVRVWEVGYFLDGEKVNLVVVDGASGEVTESWTGSAVDWPMARGKEGQFGHILNAPWIWGPLAAVFLLGLLDFRRWRKWVHLDLLVLLSFGVSQAFFNSAEIGVSVPLYYPPLLYLLARMLWIGFRGGGREGTASEGLRPSAPLWLLAVVVLGLVGLRLAANIADSGVIDVGYAGVVGADKITDAEPIYGEGSFPDNNPTGDTYGPANYFAYVPFEEALPWSGAWDNLPAAHAAAIFFDLATIVGLFALGRALVRRRESGTGEPGEVDEELVAWRTGWRRLRPRLPEPTRANVLGTTLVFAWVAYPYTTFAMQGNSNDALLSALLVWSLVLFASPAARGGLLGVASLAKFAPLALVPLYAAGERGIRLRVPEFGRTVLRPLALFTLAFAAAAALLLAHPAVDPGLADFYDRTVKSQLDRESPFSIWGQADLEWLQTVLKLAVIALALAVAFVPRRRSLAQVAALSAAVIIGVEITLEHWFYLYIPWFLGAMLLAMVARPLPDEVALPVGGDDLPARPLHPGGDPGNPRRPAPRPLARRPDRGPAGGERGHAGRRRGAAGVRGAGLRRRRRRLARGGADRDRRGLPARRRRPGGARGPANLKIDSDNLSPIAACGRWR